MLKSTFVVNNLGLKAHTDCSYVFVCFLYFVGQSVAPKAFLQKRVQNVSRGFLLTIPVNYLRHEVTTLANLQLNPFIKRVVNGSIYPL